MPQKSKLSVNARRSAFALALSTLAPVSMATVPHVFVADTPALASEVNANFDGILRLTIDP